MTATLDHLPPDVRAALARDLTIDITTIGRRSGLQRRIEIWFLNVDEQIYITGSIGRRDWLANLIANPEFTFHLKESTSADLAAKATVVDEPHERRAVFEAMSAAWYRGTADVDDLVADAPMVHVTFDAAPAQS